MKSWTVGFSIVLALSWAAASASAESVTVKANGQTSLGVTGMSVSSNVGNASFAGMYNWTVTSPGDVGGTTFTGISNFNTFCLQIGQGFSGGSTFTYSVDSINHGDPIGGNDAGYIDPTAAGQIQLLTDQYLGLINAGTKTIGGNPYTAAQIAAAFQLSLWEIEYDGGSGQNAGAPVIAGIPESFPRAGDNYFSTGNLKASGGGSSGAAAVTLANYFLDHFTLNTPGVDTTYSSFALTNSYKQDQFLGIPNPPPSNVPPVPLPAALWSGMALLGALGVFRATRRA
jgi:hypothetical protein